MNITPEVATVDVVDDTINTTGPMSPTSDEEGKIRYIFFFKFKNTLGQIKL